MATDKKAAKLATFLRSENTSLRNTIAGLEAAMKEKESENLALVASTFLLDDRIRELESENYALANAIDNDAYERAVEGRKRIVTTAGSAEILQVLAGLRTPTVTECLRIVTTLMPDRVAVCKDAWESAAEADAHFENQKGLLSLLSRLAIDYLDRVRNGQDPYVVFSTTEYAPHESEGTMARFARQRNFYWNGVRYPMKKHLKLGNDGDPRHMLRLYFDVLPDEQRILIGWCGGHLENATGY
ncbi:hypothetical protein [Sutterella sp.]|uniref:hypothetical protein n=1 Tax=Sutterella sp. TaxID=1981025 RepID=UPI0026DF27E7|nr:hypothetical protein [Sutterella sp.]MDO5532571.1 hypothetical protein [Sutterella sp.]